MGRCFPLSHPARVVLIGRRFELLQINPFPAGKAFKDKICFRIADKFASIGVPLLHLSVIQFSVSDDIRAPAVFADDFFLAHHNLVDEILEYKGGFDFIKQLFSRLVFSGFPSLQSR